MRFRMNKGRLFVILGVLAMIGLLASPAGAIGEHPDFDPPEVGQPVRVEQQGAIPSLFEVTYMVNQDCRLHSFYELDTEGSQEPSGNCVGNSPVVAIAPIPFGASNQFWFLQRDGRVSTSLSEPADYAPTNGPRTSNGCGPAVDLLPYHFPGLPSGYWIVFERCLESYGSAPEVSSFSSCVRPGTFPFVGGAVTADGDGLYLVDANANVYVALTARHFGSFNCLPGYEDVTLDLPAEGIIEVPGGGGYWVVAGDGGVFAFGSAPFLTSLPGVMVELGIPALDAPIIGIAPCGRVGYKLVAEDGGLFALGDCQFTGSLGGQGLRGFVDLWVNLEIVFVP